MTKRALRPNHKTPAYEGVAAQLREQIGGGRIAPGHRLPSETQLALEFGVSRPTIREALRTLQESGFIERISPRIMVARTPGDESAHRQLVRALRRNNVTFADLHAALLLLEPAFSRVAAERADAADLRELEENLSAQERHLNDFRAWNRLDQDFHLAIAEIAGNPALSLARAPLTRLLMPVLDRFMSSDELTSAALGRHRRILLEIAAGDGEAAELMTRRHVNEFLAAWQDSGLEVDVPVSALDDDAELPRVSDT